MTNQNQVFYYPPDMRPKVTPLSEQFIADAETIVRDVKAAIDRGDHLRAQNLAINGATRFPQHPELKKMAHILSPPVVDNGNQASNTGWLANRQWLKAHWDEYYGQWVALKNGELLANSEKLDDLVQQVGRGKDIFLTSVW